MITSGPAITVLAVRKADYHASPPAQKRDYGRGGLVSASIHGAGSYKTSSASHCDAGGTVASPPVCARSNPREGPGLEPECRQRRFSDGRAPHLGGQISVAC